MKTGIVFLFITALGLNAFAINRKCGTSEPTLAQRVVLDMSTQKSITFQSKLIKTIVHYISENEVNETAVTDQINVLNDAYRSEGFQFELVKTNAVSDADTIRAFSRGMSGANTAKAALREGDAGTLNIYLASINGLLGWATFPWDAKENPLVDGVVVEMGSLPGGSMEPYNLGQTLTHEVGHWLGLYHTFQGGCSERGDLISDTASHPAPTYGCPEAATARCGGETVEIPVSNFMNYTDDVCMTEFSELQGERMQSAFIIYRKEFDTIDF